MDISEKEMEMLVAQLAGPDTVDIARFIISNGKNVSEFLIAESLEIPINAVRNMLYRLQENNLLTFTRKKDKKKGWYIYYWTFNHSQAISTIAKMKYNRILNIKKRLKKENSSNFYTCDKKCLRIKFEHALESDFKCPECNRVLKEIDNKKIIKTLRKELTILEEAQEATAVEASA